MEAAKAACQRHHKLVTKGSKSIGTGKWTSVLIHMLSGHMQQGGLTHLEFSGSANEDIELKKD